MSEWKFDREVELARLKSVAQDMAKQVKTNFVVNPEKERNFLAATPSEHEKDASR